MLYIQQAGADALPIVTLISFLVGVIMAFVGAVQLQKFGAAIYVADLVGIAMVREMGAMMTGIVMAGRTGAAFAAQLGTMKVTQEIDALTTMGISPMEFLVLPRVLALCLMMPLLCLYSDLVGILGGAAVGVGMLGLSLPVYFQRAVPCGHAQRPGRRRLQGVGLRRADRHRRLPARHAVRQQRLGGRRCRDVGGGHRHRPDHQRVRHCSRWCSTCSGSDRRRRRGRCVRRRPRGATAPNGEAHITVRDLTMAYGSFVLMRDLNFTVNRGDIFIIMGGSGCGKSTLLRHLIGLIEPAKGEIFYGERELHHAPTPRSASACCAASACSTRAARCGAR